MAPGFEPTTFCLTSSCPDITNLTGICNSPLDDFTQLIATDLWGTKNNCFGHTRTDQGEHIKCAAVSLTCPELPEPPRIALRAKTFIVSMTFHYLQQKQLK